MSTRIRSKILVIQSVFRVSSDNFRYKMVKNGSTYETLYKNGLKSAGELAKVTGCSRATAFRVLKLLNEGESLEDRPRSGRPCKMNGDDIRLVKCIAVKRACISTKRLSKELQERRGTIVHPTTIYRTLLASGYAKKSP